LPNMPISVYYIVGGDYGSGGKASRGVKEQLKKIGADPEAIRRAMIAAYEAEMNVVIHACKGRMEATFNDGRLDVEVIDEGPGIPDVELALKEGYSTAPSAARELGFGAGMGLPNIKKNSDRFAIESEVGKGTRVSFSVNLKPAAAAGIGENSILAIPEKCRGCMYCLRTCPTRALRIRDGKPVILDYLCIDCTTCIGACDGDAITILGTTGKLEAGRDSVIVVPPAALVQFGSDIGAGQVVKLLNEMGFGDVRLLHEWENALRAAVIDYSEHEARKWPVISPMCPAAVNLVRTRFPSLLENVAPFYPPLYAIGSELSEREAIYVTSCPSQRTLLASAGFLKKGRIVLPSTLRAAVMPLISTSGIRPDKHEETGAKKEEVNADRTKVLQAAGMRHVIKMLDQIEDGQIDDVAVVELYVCDHGCFGSPLLTENPFLAEHRWHGQKLSLPTPAANPKALRRKENVTPRHGLRLDKDMTKAIEMLRQIEEQIKTLPGRDCSICGAPSCAAMAEDIVLGRAKKSACVFFR
jgi:anti-sigma regulatory factor (Ser/Thr protein kinase)/Na+-translocating ferredoxin:NAD+ oxidoreductase RNF subunit RnfB